MICTPDDVCEYDPEHDADSDEICGDVDSCVKREHRHSKTVLSECQTNGWTKGVATTYAGRSSIKRDRDNARLNLTV